MDKELQYMALLDSFKPKISNAIILLTGDGHFRVDQTVYLFKNKFADKIVVSGGLNKPENGSLLASILAEDLKDKGVPEEAIILEEDSKNTYEQAKNIISLAKSKGWEKIILVATHYHQYRAFLTFLQERNASNYDLEIFNSSAKADWFEETNWGIRIDLLKDEFSKIREYQNKGHVATFDEAIFYFQKRDK